MGGRRRRSTAVARGSHPPRRLRQSMPRHPKGVIRAGSERFHQRKTLMQYNCSFCGWALGRLNCHLPGRTVWGVELVSACGFREAYGEREGEG